MPNISIKIPNTATSALVVAAVRAATGRGIGEIATAIQESTPIFCGELFARPREVTIRSVVTLLQKLEELGIPVSIEEGGQAISPSVLRNIVRSSEESMFHLRELDEHGHS